MLCLSPQQRSSSQNLRKTPTLINLPSQEEIQEQLEALVESQSMRRIYGARPSQAKPPEPQTVSPLDNAISAKSIRLAYKPKANTAIEETYTHDQTLAKMTQPEGR